MSDQSSVLLRDNQIRSQVKIEIPCLAEFVGVARLAILGVANRISFTYDEVEDVRLAVGEACTHAIERAAEYRTYQTERGQTPVNECTLTIVCEIENSTLSITVTDTVPVGDYVNADTLDSDDGIDYQKLGTVLMEILVDEVTFDASDLGTTVRLVKTASQAN